MYGYEIPENDLNNTNANTRRSTGTRSAVMESLEWAREEEQITRYLEKDGYKTVYNCREERINQGKLEIRNIKVLEHKNHFTLLVDSKAVRSADSLDKIVSWGKVAGYIGERENVTYRTEQRSLPKPAKASVKPTAPTTARKATTAAVWMTTPTTVKKATTAVRKKLIPYKPSTSWVSSLTLSEKLK